MRCLHYLTVILLLCLGLGILAGCEAAGKAINKVKVVNSWNGKSASAVIAAWGQPAEDVSGSALIARGELIPMAKTTVGPVSVSRPDPKVKRVLVYQPAKGATLASSSGKKQFTVEAQTTSIYLALDANDTVMTWKMTESDGSSTSTSSGGAP